MSMSAFQMPVVFEICLNVCLNFTTRFQYVIYFFVLFDPFPVYSLEWF